jgi:hypothetical protein
MPGFDLFLLSNKTCFKFLMPNFILYQLNYFWYYWYLLTYFLAFWLREMEFGPRCNFWCRVLFWYYLTYFWFFSSREHKMLKVSFCDRNLSSIHRPPVRPSSIFYPNDFFSKTTWPNVMKSSWDVSSIKLY